MTVAHRAVALFSPRQSPNRFTLRQRVGLFGLKVKRTTTHSDHVAELLEMPRVRWALGRGPIPAPSTHCKAFGRFVEVVCERGSRMKRTGS